jgi:hypothetical protein
MNDDKPSDDSTSPPPESVGTVPDGAATGTATVTGASPAAPQESKESKGAKEVLEPTADFPGLVDLLVGNDGGVWFWFLWPDGSHFEFLQKHAPGRSVGDKDIIEVPPLRSALPWLLPRGAEVHRWLKEDTDAAYFAALQEWICRHIDLADERHVVLLAAWIAHSYLVDLCSASPYIVFLGPAETGKSRALAACVHAARRGILTMTPREAALIRYTAECKATIGIDTIDFMDAIRNTRDFFAARTKKDGTMTTRVLDYRKGPFEGMQHYEAYGATLVASNKPLSDDIIASRSLVLQACQGTRRFLENVTPELAQPLRERGTAFRARVLKREYQNALPPVPDLAPGRLGDMLSGLALATAICDGAAVAVLKELVPSFAKARQTEAADTIEVDVLKECLTQSSSGARQILLTSLVEAVNAGRPGERLLSGHGLAPLLRTSLGLEVFASTGNQRFVGLDTPKLATLAKRYGLVMPAVNEVTSPRRPRTPRQVRTPRKD